MDAEAEKEIPLVGQEKGEEAQVTSERGPMQADMFKYDSEIMQLGKSRRTNKKKTKEAKDSRVADTENAAKKQTEEANTVGKEAEQNVPHMNEEQTEYKNLMDERESVEYWLRDQDTTFELAQHLANLAAEVRAEEAAANMIKYNPEMQQKPKEVMDNKMADTENTAKEKTKEADTAGKDTAKKETKEAEQNDPHTNKEQVDNKNKAHQRYKECLATYSDLKEKAEHAKEEYQNTSLERLKLESECYLED